MNWWRWTVICTVVLGASELMVLGIIPLTGMSWYYRGPGWHADLLNILEITFAILVGVVWIAGLFVLSGLALCEWRRRRREG